MATGPDPTLMETMLKHVGCPVRAESRVTRSGTVPEIYVVGISTWIRTPPEGDVRLVIWLKGIEVFPTDPRSAVYEESESVNSNEWREPSYM